MPQRKCPADIAAEIADGLHSSSIHLLRWVREVDRESPVTATQLSALSVVVFKGPISLKALAAAEQVRPPSMSRLVDALETKALVRRETDATDRRSVRITATAAGKKVLGDGRRRRLERLAAPLQQLNTSQQRTLARAIAILDDLIPG